MSDGPTFTCDRDNLRFVWHGGEYIDVLVKCQPGHIHEVLDQPGYRWGSDIIGVWDSNAEASTIARTQEAFEAEVDAWLADDGDETA